METKAHELKYAGFWRRAMALIIDYIIISIIVFPLILLIEISNPESVVVSVPFGLFTTEEVIKENNKTHKNNDGSTTAITEQVVLVSVLNKWKYHYMKIIKHNAGRSEAVKYLINPETNKKVDKTTLDDIAIFLIIIYWSIMESRDKQASFGKMALNMKVINNRGCKLSFAQSLGRNVLKILSSIILMIGFMMAGWTNKKQALHDMMVNCYVIVEE